MRTSAPILSSPFTGRGTTRSVVEGRRWHTAVFAGGPSVSRLRDCHLPVPGRIDA